MPWAEQAIFTSIRGPRLDGYQLAATSAGVTSEMAKELTQWGPAHDSLYDPPLARPSVAWFPLTTGSFCLAITQPTAGEYSGRKGPRVYTHFVLVPSVLVERLANPAWQIYHVLQIAGRFLVRDPVPKSLERCPLSLSDDRSQVSSVGQLPEFAGFVRERLEHADSDSALAIPCEGDANARLAALWQTLPKEQRRTTSFCTGLRHSLRRPFRVQAVPQDAPLLRQLGRESRLEVLERVANRDALIEPQAVT